MKSIGISAVAPAALFLLVSSLPALGAEGDKTPWHERITLAFGVTGVFQGTSGNDYGESKDQWDYSYSADMALIGELTGGHTLNLVFEAGEGEAAADNFGARGTPNYDAAVTHHEVGVTATLAQAYYEGEFMDGRLSVAIGKMDVHAYTDHNEYANDETSQFLNGLFVRSTGVVFAEHGSYYVPAIALTWRPFDLASIKYTYSHDGGDDFFNGGYHWLEAGLHPRFGELTGNYRVAYVQHDIDYTDITTGGEKSGGGINVSADQLIAPDIGLFFRYAVQNDELKENEVTSAISGGVSVGGALWGREGDAAGVAYGHVELNGSVVKEHNEGESVFEAYYSFKVNGHLRIAADYQMIANLERPRKRDVSVFGFRAQAEF